MKKIITTSILSSTILMSGLLYNFSAAEGTADIDAKQVFENKCGICHSLDRPKSKKKTLQEWESTVMRMKNSNGAPITDEEAELIIDHLVKEYGKEESQ